MQCAAMSDITGTFWFFFVTVSASVRADVFYFNDEVDGFFGQFREDVQQSNNSRWPLPNIHAVYRKNLFLLSLTGEINGTQGSVRDVATIKRTSNVTILTAREYFLFRGEFGFDDLTVNYKYKARFMGIPLEGDLEVTVGDNSIYLELLMNLTNSRCSGNVVTVRELRLSRLERISGHVTGFSVLNGLADWWLRRQLAAPGASVLLPIQRGMAAFLQANLRQFDFCQFGRVPDNRPFTDDQDLTVIEPDDSVNAVMS